MELNILNNKGEKSGVAQFDENIVSSKASPALLHEVIVAHRAGIRAGSHSAKTRSEVSGSGVKPWRQKGTGRARAGSTRSPLWRHGGVIFGPVPRSYRQGLPKKKKKIAFKLAIKEVLEGEKLQVVDPITISEPKTKNVAEIYSKWKAPKGSLYVVDQIDPMFQRASRNINTVKATPVESLNTYECLKARRIFITKSALDNLTVRIKGKEGAES